MLFTGEYEHALDSKHRLAIPAEIRSEMERAEHAPTFYLVPGANGCPWLWPESTFARMAKAMSQDSLLPPEELMDFEEFMFSQSTRLEIDKTGRIRLPERVIQQHGLSERVMILGVNDHLELRHPDAWREKLERNYQRQSEIMLRARRALDESGRGSTTGPRDGGDRE